MCLLISLVKRRHLADLTELGRKALMWLIPESSPTSVKWTETAADEMEESVKCLQKKIVQKHIMFNLGWNKTVKLLNRDQDLNLILSRKTGNTCFA